MPDRSLSRRPTPGASTGEVGAEVVESRRRTPVAGAAKVIDAAARRPFVEVALRGWLSPIIVRCGLDRIELACDGGPKCCDAAGDLDGDAESG